ncbi:MAG: SBBP repeat-containing protein, partial [Aequorivita sp.]|nr:SBBP repeat-containing protein [Aequorivita sp.]
MKNYKFIFYALLITGVNMLAQSTEWAVSMGAGSADLGKSLVLDENGNTYVTGEFTGTVDFDPGPGVHNLISQGDFEIFILKLDLNGDFVWAKRIGGVNEDKASSIAFDSFGDILITGSFKGTSDFDPGVNEFNLTSIGMMDSFIAKLDTGGNFIWAKQMGGSRWAIGDSIITDIDSNIYSTGRFWETVDFNPSVDVYNLTSEGESDIYISKLDRNGNFIWAKKIGSISWDVSTHMAIDNFGDVYVTGYFRGAPDFDPGTGVYNLTSVGIEDSFVLKLDSDGNFIWAKSIGGFQNDEAYGLTTDSDGNSYTIGYFTGAVDFNPGTGIYNLISEGEIDIFILKLDSNGEFVWAHSFGSSDYDFGSSIITNDFGNIYATGYFSGIIDFDPGTDVYNLTSIDEKDIFILKLDTSGNFNWAVNIGGSNIDFSTSIGVDNMDNVYTTGGFYGNIDFDPSVGTNTATSAGLDDIFVLKTNQNPLEIQYNLIANEVSISPNPTNGLVNIDFGNLNKINLRVFNANGKTVYYKNKISTKSYQFEIQGASGV